MYLPVSKSATVLLIAISLLYSSCRDKESFYAEDLFEWLEWNNTGTDTTTYYVSVNGNDNNKGTSKSTAFRTLSKALMAVHEGGSIRILPGNYQAAIAFENCNAQKEITIEGFEGTPVFDGQSSKPGALFLNNCSNISFDGIEFKNYTDFGIGASNCRKLKFIGLTLQNNGHRVQLTGWEMEGHGLYVDESDEVLIEDCEAFENGPNPQVFPDRLMGTGIDTWKLTNSILRNNHTHHNIGGGILVEDGVNVIVEGNEVHDNDLDASADEWWDGGLWVDGGRDIFIRNNNFYNNLGPGIEISDEDKQFPTGYVLENNTSTGNYFGIHIWNFGTTDWPDSSILININNDFSGNQQKDVWIIP